MEETSAAVSARCVPASASLPRSSPSGTLCWAACADAPGARPLWLPTGTLGSLQA